MTCPDPNALTVAERTGHRRYCELTDPAHPDYNPAYVALVARLAAEPWPPTPAPPEAKPSPGGG